MVLCRKVIPLKINQKLITSGEPFEEPTFLSYKCPLEPLDDTTLLEFDIKNPGITTVSELEAPMIPSGLENHVEGK
jgi:hypothetical protein